MKENISCLIPSSSISYPIQIGKGILTHHTFGDFCTSLANKIAIVTDSNVAQTYGQWFQKHLQQYNIPSHLFIFPAGEQHKTRQTKEILEDQMISKGFGRDSCLIAMGGGVSTDLGAYLASTYCRGIPLIIVPTSLLCMVDACIGGKNGVNTSTGKNLIGTLYHPKGVFIDIATLRNLPKTEIQNGVVEMIKHALIADSNYFSFLENEAVRLMHLDEDIITEAILRSCKIKLAIVSEDSKEQGKRHLLNFGHTIGHALEISSNYQLSHGEAVARGIVIESYVAHLLGHLSTEIFDKICNIFDIYGIPLDLDKNCSFAAIKKIMSHDKKSVKGTPRFVLLQEIGKPKVLERQYCFSVDENILENAIYRIQMPFK